MNYSSCVSQHTHPHGTFMPCASHVLIKSCTQNDYLDVQCKLISKVNACVCMYSMAMPQYIYTMNDRPK